MEVSRLRRLSIEVSKFLTLMRLGFSKVIFSEEGQFDSPLKMTRANRVKTTLFGEKSLRALGPKIWNSPEDVKDLTSLQRRIY